MPKLTSENFKIGYVTAKLERYNKRLYCEQFCILITVSQLLKNLSACMELYCHKLWQLGLIPSYLNPGRTLN
jgi:hypothetical protein